MYTPHEPMATFTHQDPLPPGSHSLLLSSSYLRSTGPYPERAELLAGADWGEIIHCAVIAMSL